MEPPAAYGSFHLSFFIVGFAAAIALAWFLRKLGDRGNRRLLFLCGLFLVATEVYKQFFCFFIIGNGQYVWSKFPFQMCSIPMYFLLIVPFLKEGAVQDAIYSFMMIYNLMGGMITFIEPSGMSLPYLTLTLHAYLWHLMLVFIGFYLGFSDRTKKRMKDFGSASIVMAVLFGMAFLINLVLWKPAEGHINMFFVGPANSPLFFFKEISEKYGWYISTLLYVPLVYLAGFVIYLPFYLVHRSNQKKNPSERTKSC